MISIRKLKKFEKKFLKDEIIQNIKFIDTHYVSKVDRYRAVIMIRAIMLTYLLFIPIVVFLPFIMNIVKLQFPIDQHILPVVILPFCFILGYFLQFLFGGLFITKKNKKLKFYQYASAYSNALHKEPNPKVVIVISRFEEKGIIIPKGNLQEIVPYGRWETWTDRLNNSIQKNEITKELPNLIKDIDELISLHTVKESDEITSPSGVRID